MKYGEIAAAPTTAATYATKYVSFGSAKNSIVVRIATSTSAVPRSGCLSTSKAGTATAASGTNSSHHLRYLRLGFASTAATESITRSLAGSDGWKTMGPTPIQR